MTFSTEGVKGAAVLGTMTVNTKREPVVDIESSFRVRGIVENVMGVDVTNGVAPSAPVVVSFVDALSPLAERRSVPAALTFKSPSILPRRRARTNHVRCPTRDRAIDAFCSAGGFEYLVAGQTSRRGPSVCPALFGAELGRGRSVSMDRIDVSTDCAGLALSSPAARLRCSRFAFGGIGGADPRGIHAVAGTVCLRQSRQGPKHFVAMMAFTKCRFAPLWHVLSERRAPFKQSYCDVILQRYMDLTGETPRNQRGEPFKGIEATT